MKSVVLYLCVLLGLSMSSKAQVLLGGPGMHIGSYYIYTTPSFKRYNIGQYYLYEIHGYYGRLDLSQSRYNPSYCLWACGAVQMNYRYWYPQTINLQTYQSYASTGDKKFTSARYRFSKKNISLGFYLGGNTSSPNGYMVLFGSVLKNPPCPTGELTVPNYILENTKALVQYRISRPDIEELTQTVDWEPSTWTLDNYPR